MIATLKNKLVRQKLGRELLVIAAILILYKLLYWSFFEWFFDGKSANIFNKIFSTEFSAETVYGSFSYVLASLGNVYFFFPVFILTILLFWKRKSLEWGTFEHPKLVRWFILLLAGFLTWNYAFYDFNFYFDQGHVVDRLLLICLLVGVWRSPIFIPGFLAVCLLAMGQFNYPLGSPTVVDKKVVIEFLMIFCAFVLVRPFVKVKVTTLFVLMISLLAANYFIPMLGKMQLGRHWYSWTLESDLHVHYQISLARGWLSFVSEETREGIGNFIRNWNSWLVIGTSIIELSAIVLLLNRKLSIVLFIAFSLFHIGVFFESGIFFWKWILFNLTFVIILWKANEHFKRELFTKSNFLISLVLVLCSTYVFDPVRLSWLDTNFGHGFEYYAVDNTGNETRFSPNRIRPYQHSTTFHRFQYLVDDSVQVARVSNVDHEVFETLRDINFQQFDQWADSNCAKTYSARRTMAFSKFINQWIDHYNGTGDTRYVWSYLKAPDHIYTTKFLNSSLPEAGNLMAVKLYYNQWFVENGEARIWRRDLVFDSRVHKFDSLALTQD